jgi:hypothetical protein
MAVLVWDQIGDHTYETGVSKGVLYGHDGYGVPWNGLTSIDEDVGDKADPLYFDGVKFNNVITPGDFNGSLRAFTYPEEFSYYEGAYEDQTGFYVLHQPQSMFSLSYQTRVSNDLDPNAGYKIHLLYNLIAIPAQRSFKTLTLDIEPTEFEWSITGTPEELEGYRPTVHVIFDTTELDPYLLSDLEDILYGSDINDAYLPTLKGLASFINNWDRLIITDNGDGTWTAYSPLPDVITMIDDTTFQIVSDTATYLDADTYTISSSDKNEGDIWQPLRA